MKNVAISVDNVNVSEHFGYSEKFLLFRVENNQIIDKSVLVNPGHHPGIIPEYLHQNNVNVLICGGIGLSAINLFKRYHIEIISGIKGNFEKVMTDYLNELLVSDNQSCENHLHKDEHH